MWTGSQQKCSNIQEAILIKEILEVHKFSWLTSIPFISSSSNIEEICDIIAKNNQSDYSWAVCFNSDFIANLMYRGFIPICYRLDIINQPILLPKLHIERCVLRLDNLHCSLSNLKKARRYGFELSIDTAFEEVCQGISHQHGDECWLHEPLLSSLRNLFERRTKGSVGGKLFFHSFELWDAAKKKLVAGEIGYIIGSSYTSMTGFRTVSASGSILLTSIGSLLWLRGFRIWDLGMELDYKHALGAKSISRSEFLTVFKESRDESLLYLCFEKLPVSSILDAHFSAKNTD